MHKFWTYNHKAWHGDPTPQNNRLKRKMQICQNTAKQPTHAVDHLPDNSIQLPKAFLSHDTFSL